MVRLFFAIFLISQLIFPVSIFAEIIGNFTQVKPDVSLSRAGKELKPDVGHDVSTGDLITAGKGARAKMLFKDDSVLILAQNTKLEIKEYLIEKEKRNGILSLQAGKLKTEVTKFLTPDSRFEVHTPTAIAAARGSDWLSIIESNPGSAFYCLDGIVSVVNPAFPTQIVTLTAGQFTVVAVGMAPTIPAMFTPQMIQPTLNEMGITAPAAAPGAAAAEAAGEAAGVATTAGITAGTIAAATIAAAVIAGVVVAAGAEGKVSKKCVDISGYGELCEGDNITTAVHHFAAYHSVCHVTALTHVLTTLHEAGITNYTQ
ncbi:MAG: FecR domain-containing protein [Nitrospirae bacterium]|nr:FecR domain-containing protein [Nitrospirota bacterium]